MTKLLLVVCSMMLAQQLQTHKVRSWSWDVEPEDHHVLLSGVEKEQCLRYLIGRAHSDNLAP